jgi:NitT/TauT family transport system substrate-binding protein/sulfonate transport system substrate-binding protein
MLALAGCGGGSSASGGALRVGVIVSSGNEPSGIENWAYQQGTLQSQLKAAGIDSVQFIAFPNGPNLNQALKGGSLDVGVLGDTPAISGRAADLPTQLSGVSIRGQEAWLIAAPGVHSLADLKGKTVATQQGSYMHRYLGGLLDSAGLASSVKVTFLLANSAQQALDKGDIAAYAAPVSTGPLLLFKGYQAIDKASAHPGLTGNSYITIAQDVAKEYPKLGTAWNTAIADAATKLKADPEQYHAYVAKINGLPVDVVRASYPASVFGDPRPTAADVQTVQDTLNFTVAQKLASAPFDVNSWVAPGVAAA